MNMRFLTPRRVVFIERLLCALALSATAGPALAAEPNQIWIAESKGENVEIKAGKGEAARKCLAAGGRTSPYLQELNSEVGEAAVYLKAARMGGGIYMHLPYLVAGGCKDVGFHVSARHILWDG